MHHDCADTTAGRVAVVGTWDLCRQPVSNTKQRWRLILKLKPQPQPAAPGAAPADDGDDDNGDDQRTVSIVPRGSSVMVTGP